MRRRNILQSIGASSASLTVLGTTGVQAATSENENSSTRLTGEIRTDVLDDIKNDVDVRRLIDEVDDKGWSPKWADASVNRTRVEQRKNSGRFDSAFVEFEKDDNGEMFLLWMGNSTLGAEEFGPVIHHFEKTKGASAQSATESYDRSTAYSVSGKEITKESGDFHPDTSPERGVHAASSGYCEIDVCLVPESDFSLSCLVRLIVDAGLAGLACLGSLVTWPAVIGCLGAIGMTGDQAAQCITGGHGCDEVKTVEVEKEWLREEANQPEENPCEAHGSHNDKTYPMTKEYFEEEVPTKE